MHEFLEANYMQIYVDFAKFSPFFFPLLDNNFNCRNVCTVLYPSCYFVGLSELGSVSYMRFFCKEYFQNLFSIIMK